MSVTISELKNHLSRYIREVAAGGTVLVRNRDRIVARIEPAGDVHLGDGDRIDELEARGQARRARTPMDPEWLAARPRLKNARLTDAVLEERRDDR